MAYLCQQKATRSASDCKAMAKRNTKENFYLSFTRTMARLSLGFALKEVSYSYTNILLTWKSLLKQ